MSNKQTVIYWARTAEDAHFLKNLLTDAGIWATVTAEHSDVVALPQSGRYAQVVVHQDDVPAAREIAAEFDRQGKEVKNQDATPVSLTERICSVFVSTVTLVGVLILGAPMLLILGIPRVIGRLWRYVKAIQAPDDKSLPDDWPTCPKCSQRRTTSCPFCGETGTDFRPADRMPEESAEDEPFLVICPTCDEPFPPHYAPVCECGHVFETKPKKL